jgi:hypothetical protein
MVGVGIQTRIAGPAVKVAVQNLLLHLRSAGQFRQLHRDLMAVVEVRLMVQLAILMVLMEDVARHTGTLKTLSFTHNMGLLTSHSYCGDTPAQ